MLKTRVITAVIFVPILLLLIYFGGWPLTIGLGVLTGVGMYEYGKMMELKGQSVPYLLLIIAAVALMIAVSHKGWGSVVLIFIAALVLLIVWTMKKESDFSGIMLQAGGIMYIGLGFGFVLLLRLPAASWNLLFLAFLLTWATDVGAYFFGRALGRKKLSPTISPNKTVEGAIGGVICAVVVTFIFGLFFMELPWYWLVVLAIVGSLVGQFGDLFESMIKRWSGIKDSGKFFPGHGGVLDRFDSVLFVAPFVYLINLLASML